MDTLHRVNLMLSLNSNRERETAGDLHAANEHVESPNACCLLVLNTKLRREPTQPLQPDSSTPHSQTETPKGKKFLTGPVTSGQGS